MRAVLAAIAASVSLFAVALTAQAVTHETVPGVLNFARLETTIACAGATNASAVPEIGKLGFHSIIFVPVWLST